MTIKIGLSLVMITHFFSVSCYIYQATVLKRRDSGSGQDHYFVGLSDYHDKKHPMTDGQLSSLFTFIEALPQENTQVLVEDLSSAGNQGRVSCGTFSINSRGGILGGIAQELQRRNVAMNNIEYRYCRVCSLSPVLNNISQNSSNFQPTKTILMKQLVDEIQALIAEIQRYRDGSLLSAMYKKKIKEITKELRKLNFNKDLNVSVADYFERHCGNDRLAFIKKLLTFDSALVDLSLVHKVVQNVGQHTVVIAGGSHVSHVSDILRTIGFETMHTSSLSYSKETDLAQCLGSHIVDGAFCVKPNALDLQILQQLVIE